MGRRLSIVVLIILLCVVSFSFVQSASAITKSVTLNWTQEFKDPNAPNASFFRVYRKAEGGSYLAYATVPFTGVQAEYDYMFDETFYGGQITTYYYYITMTNTDAVETNPSNEKSVTKDLTPDSPPVQGDPVVEE